METLTSTIKYIINSNIINFTIMVYILYAIIKKADLKSHFINSIKKVEKNIKTSEEEKEKSQQKLGLAIKKLEKLPHDIEEIEKFAFQKTEVFKQQFEESTKDTINHIQQNLKKSIVIEEKKISNEITLKTLENSIQQAKQNIINQLKTNPDLHQKFIEESLSELDKVNLS